MNRVYGTEGCAAICCTNPRKNKWRVRWDFQTDEQGFNYMEHEFDHKPSVDEIEPIVTAYYNQQTTEAIVQGFQWKGHKVWLTNENQLNYKVAYDLAVQTRGQNLPVTFKFDEKFYQEFATFEELQEFYLAFTSYVQQCIEEGWKKKDNVDYNLYNVNIGYGKD